MPLPRTLVSALLCLALVLNGIGGAMAGVRTGCAGAGDMDRGGHDAQPAAMAASDPHAGHHADGHHAGGHHDDTHPMPMPVVPTDDNAGHDCPHDDGCGDCSTACRSACIAQHAFAILPATAPPVVIPQHVPPHPPVSAHPAPALRDPVRPPIGQAV
jgi:hypothetical protein